MASYTVHYIKCNECGKIYELESLYRYMTEPWDAAGDRIAWGWDGPQPQRRLARGEGWVLKVPGGTSSRDYCPSCVEGQQA